MVEYGDYNREAFIGTFLGAFSTKSRAEEAIQKLEKEFPGCRYEVGVATIDDDPITGPILSEGKFQRDEGGERK